MLRDIKTRFKTSRALSPNSSADNTQLVTEIIDNLGFDSLLYAFLWGSLADAAATWVIEVFESDSATMVGETVVADKDLNGTELAAGVDQSADDTVTKIGYVGSKQFTRVKITVADNGTAALTAVLAIQGHAHAEPVA